MSDHVPGTHPDAGVEAVPPEIPSAAGVVEGVPVSSEPAAKPSASIATHPWTTSEAEGLFAVPQEKVVDLLNKTLKLKYTGVILYMNYGDRLLAHWRDAVADHFKDHIKDERAGAYTLTRKITALGGSPQPKIAQIKDVSSFHQMVMQIMTAETELLQAERALIEVAGDNIALRLMAEELYSTDAHHLDDMRRLLLCEA